MANKVENRISYAAAYALLKKYAEKNAITPEKFEKLNRLMADLYMCDPIVTQEKGVEESILHKAICRGVTNCIPETGEVKKMVALMLTCDTSKDKMLMEWQEVQQEIKELMKKADAAETMCFKTQGNKEPYMEQIKKILCLHCTVEGTGGRTEKET